MPYIRSGDIVLAFDPNKDGGRGELVEAVVTRRSTASVTKKTEAATCG